MSLNKIIPGYLFNFIILQDESGKNILFLAVVQFALWQLHLLLT